MSKTISNNGAFRKKKVFFTQVSNVAIRDNNLSSKAKGLYALIQSFITIENFTLYKNTLKKHMLEKDTAFEGMWKELKEKGYLIQYKIKNEKGLFFYEYELLDEPNLELANEVHNPKKTAKTSHSIQTPKIKGVDNLLCGEHGTYNNTNLNNTNLNNTNSNGSSSSTEEKEEDIDEVKFKNDSKKSEDLKTLSTLCQNLNFKLRKADMENLLLAYSVDKITEALMIATATTTFQNNEIRNYKAYLFSTIKDINTTKTENKNITVNNTITNQQKQLAFTNYRQRESTAEEDALLERQLLGWE